MQAHAQYSRLAHFIRFDQAISGLEMASSESGRVKDDNSCAELFFWVSLHVVFSGLYLRFQEPQVYQKESK